MTFELQASAPRMAPAARLYIRIRPHIPEFLQTLLDISWAALDVARHTRSGTPSGFIDLVAGGNRECLGDQPDLFYSAAFIEVTRGREYRMRIPPSDAVCTHVVMTSHRDGTTTQTSWATRSAEEACKEQVIRICEAPQDPTVLDSTPHEGLCIAFVRQYFLKPVDASRYAQHEPQLEMTKVGASARRRMPAPVEALWRFLPIRALTVTVKYLTLKLRLRRTTNVWGLTNVDNLKGGRARIKEVLVNDRGRYFFLDLSLRDGEAMEVRYRPEPHTWSSVAFVSSATRTLAYRNLCDCVGDDADGFVRLKVGTTEMQSLHAISTKGRRDGTLIIREVSIDGRRLPKDVETPKAAVVREV